MEEACLPVAASWRNHLSHGWSQVNRRSYSCDLPLKCHRWLFCVLAIELFYPLSTVSRCFSYRNQNFPIILLCPWNPFTIGRIGIIFLTMRQSLLLLSKGKKKLALFVPLCLTRLFFHWQMPLLSRWTFFPLSLCTDAIEWASVSWKLLRVSWRILRIFFEILLHNIELINSQWFVSVNQARIRHQISWKQVTGESICSHQMCKSTAGNIHTVKVNYHIDSAMYFIDTRTWLFIAIFKWKRHVFPHTHTTHQAN